MRIKPHSRLLFIGDSITDCGRKRPIGEGISRGSLGTGYVNLVDTALTAEYPDSSIHLINMGVAGDTVRDLKTRWKTDVLDLKPDWLAIMIGINDVWQQVNWPSPTPGAISVQEYRQTLDQLIQETLPHLKGLVLMTPYYLEPDRSEPMRAMMDTFRESVVDLASRHQALLIDTQAEFDHLMGSKEPLELAGDRVHINLAGHMLLARAFLRSIGLSRERQS